MKITKEQIKQLDKQETTVRELFPDVFKIKLEVGKWYKNSLYGYIFCFNGIYGHYSQYGVLADGRWSDSISSHIMHFKNFVPATNAEVETALMSEAIKRGYKEGDNVGNFNGHEEELILSNAYDFSSTGLFFMGGTCIFEKGNWAKIVEPSIEDLLNEIIDVSENNAYVKNKAKKALELLTNNISVNDAEVLKNK